MAAASGAFTPPTSVITARGFQSVDDRTPRTTSATARTGVATTTRSASGSSPVADRAPSSTARSATPGRRRPRSRANPAGERAMPTEPPMRPVPKIMARPGPAAPWPGGRCRRIAASVGEVVTEPLGALEVDVVHVGPGSLGGHVHHHPDAEGHRSRPRPARGHR